MPLSASQPLANVFKRFFIQNTKANIFLPTEAYTYGELVEGHITSDQFVSLADLLTKMLRGWLAHTATLIHHRCEQKTSIPSKSCTHGSNVKLKSRLFNRMSAREKTWILTRAVCQLASVAHVGHHGATAAPKARTEP